MSDKRPDSDIVQPIESEMERAVAKLIEMGCESVLILTTISVGGGTNWMRKGGGNSFAQWGSAREYFSRCDEQARSTVRPVGD